MVAIASKRKAAGRQSGAGDEAVADATFYARNIAIMAPALAGIVMNGAASDNLE